MISSLAALRADAVALMLLILELEGRIESSTLAGFTSSAPNSSA